MRLAFDDAGRGKLSLVLLSFDNEGSFTYNGCGSYRGGIELFSIGDKSLNDLGALFFRTTYARI